MTNTRLGDPEIIERRYPIVLRTFILRDNSGGAGKNRGGDGVVREIEFRRTLTVSILSERRTFRPYGMDGGQPGLRGVNTLFRYFPEGAFSAPEPYKNPFGKVITGGKQVNVGGKATIEVYSGDVLRICSPGGGGYGVPDAGAPGAYGDDVVPSFAPTTVAESNQDVQGPNQSKVGVVHPSLAGRASGSVHLLAEIQSDF